MPRPRLDGRRGAALLVLGIAWAALGYSYFGVDVSSAGPGLYVVAQLLPLEVWGALWALSGAVALVTAFTRRNTAGFVSLTLLPFTWALNYFGAWLFDISARGWVLGAIFAALGSLVVIVAGMDDPRRYPATSEE